MRPIRTGDRGPAVEDVQRRLLSLGYDLGSDGVDGVFLERTADAVSAFQRGLGLAQDGEVGPRTWAALVDSTFRLGDRLLYLRRPHFHGRDVSTLQGALNVLGFSCGGPDGIFGVYTERAVREFQTNCGLVPDGVAGDETVRAIANLRHVWEGKDPTAPAALTLAAARRGEVLARTPLALVPHGRSAGEVAARIVNLGLAGEPSSKLRVARVAAKVGAEEAALHLLSDGHPAPDGVPVVAVPLANDRSTAPRLVAAFASGRCDPPILAVDLSELDLDGERACQRVAVSLLDAVCAALG